jgi:hypothetical protein
MGSMTFNVLSGKEVGYVKIVHRCQHLGYGSEPIEPERQVEGRRRRRRRKDYGGEEGDRAKGGYEEDEEGDETDLNLLLREPIGSTTTLTGLEALDPYLLPSSTGSSLSNQQFTHVQAISLLRSYQNFLNQQNEKGLWSFISSRVETDLEAIKKTLDVVEQKNLEKMTEEQRQYAAIKRAQAES